MILCAADMVDNGAFFGRDLLVSGADGVDGHHVTSNHDKVDAMDCSMPIQANMLALSFSLAKTQGLKLNQPLNW